MLIATKFHRMRGIVRFAGHEVGIKDGLQASPSAATSWNMR